GGRGRLLSLTPKESSYAPPRLGALVTPGPPGTEPDVPDERGCPAGAPLPCGLARRRGQGRAGDRRAAAGGPEQRPSLARSLRSRWRRRAGHPLARRAPPAVGRDVP